MVSARAAGLEKPQSHTEKKGDDVNDFHKLTALQGNAMLVLRDSTNERGEKNLLGATKINKLALCNDDR